MKKSQSLSQVSFGFFKIMFRAVRHFAVALLVIGALYVTFGRIFAHSLENYQISIQSYLQNKTHLPFKFKKLEASWAFFYPVLRLHDVTLNYQNDEQLSDRLSIPYLGVELDIFSSLFSFSFVFKNIEVEGLKVTFEQEAEGSWSLVGAEKRLVNIEDPLSSQKKKQADNKSEKADFFTRVLKHEAATFKNSTLIFKSNNQTYHFLSQALNLAVIDDRYHIFGSLDQLDDELISLDLKANLSTDKTSFDRFSGSVYLSLDPAKGTDFLSRITEKSRYSIINALVATKLWLDIEEGAVKALTGEIDLKQIKIKNNKKEKSEADVSNEFFSLEGISGYFKFDRTAGGGWRFIANQLTILDDETISPITKLYVENHLNEKKSLLGKNNFLKEHADQEYVINAQSIKITPVIERAIKFFMGEKTGPFSFSGSAEQLAIHGWLLKNKLIDFEGVATFNELSFSRGTQWPEFSGLNGETYFSNKQASFLLNANNFSVDLKNITRGTLAGEKMQGGIVFEQNESGWLLKSNLVSVETEDAKSVTAFKLSKNIQDSNPYLFLLSEVFEGRAQATSKYIPVHKLSPGLVSWLDKAIVAGYLNRGDFLYAGKLLLPVAEMKQRTFQMYFDVSQATLDYAAPWPKVHDASINALIDGRETFVQVSAGQVLDSTVKNFTVDILPHTLLTSKIYAQGIIEASIKDGFTTLEQGLFKESWIDFLKEIEPKGNAVLNLKLEIPLPAQPNDKARKSIEPALIRVIAEVKNADFLLKQYRLPVSNLSGVFTYDSQKGLTSPSIKAKILDKSVTGKVGSEFQYNKFIATKVSINGKAEMRALYDWTLNPLLLNLSGESDYVADIVLYNDQVKDRSNFIEVNSNLQGVEVGIPVPFYKSAEQVRAFSYNLSGKDDDQRVSVDYGSILRADLLFNKNEVKACNIFLGDKKNVLEQKNIDLMRNQNSAIVGAVEKININQWRWFAKQLKRKIEAPVVSDVAKISLSPSNASKNTIESWVALIDSAKLKVEELIFDKHSWFDINFDLLAGESGWDIAVKNTDVDAKITAPTDWENRGIDIHLSEYRFTKNPLIDQVKKEEALNVPAPLAAIHKVNPNDWIPFRFVLDHLFVEGQDWGGWSFIAEKQKDGLLFNQAFLRLNAIDMAGNISWRWNDGAPTTHFLGDIKVKNLGNVQQQWGYTPTIKSESTVLEADLSWLGSPIDFKLSSSEGSANVSIKKGQLLDVESKASSVKVIGLLNFETLIRRMQLDFRDLYQKGLAYDEIAGRLNFHDGSVITKGIKMEGPSVKFKISGSVDLLNKKVDQKMALTLPLSRNLILPAAATGGLPLAATAYVLEWALGKQIDKLTTLYFHLQGHWDDPQVTQANYFNFGGDK